MENHKDFHHDDLLDRAVDMVLSDPIPDDLPPDRVAQLAAVVRQAADQPYPNTIITRIKNMRLSTRIAVAATVLVAVFGLMSWLLPDSGPAVAFADVAEALTKVRSATWKSTMTFTEPQSETFTQSTIEMYLAPSHQRTETTSSRGLKMTIIVDGLKNKAIWLDPVKKRAAILDEYIDPKNPPPADPKRTIQGLQKLIADARRGKVGKVERLGVKTIDGHSTVGFRIQEGVIETKIWADSKTLLPVRLEERMSIPGRSYEVYTVTTDFQVGVDLDESLFSLDVPDGYTAQQGVVGRLSVVERAPNAPKLEEKLKAKPPKTPEP